MAGVSVSHLILFIASMVIAAGVAGTVTTSVSQVSSAVEESGVDASEEIRTDVEVISDAGRTVYNGSGDENVTVLVKNTGSRDLTAREGVIDVVLDGEYRSDVGVTVVDGDAWTEQNVARVNVSAPALTAGDHRLKLTVGGDEEVFRFRT